MANGPSLPQIVAVADVGSTSVHLLVARVTGHDTSAVVDESVFLGLGERSRGEGSLGRPVRDDLVRTLVAYVETARRADASTVALVATEPLRVAADADAAISEIAAATNLPIEVLASDEEALCTLVGVTGARRIEHEFTVIDVGGGSTELVAASPTKDPLPFGLPVGAAALTASIDPADPPTAGDLRRLREGARTAVGTAPGWSVGDLVGVGGTASNLVRLLGDRVDDRRLTLSLIAEALATLEKASAESLAWRTGIRPARVRLLPAGAAILEAVLQRYGLPSMRVSEASLREGIALLVAAGGPAWRRRLPALARGWD